MSPETRAHKAKSMNGTSVVLKPRVFCCFRQSSTDDNGQRQAHRAAPLLIGCFCLLIATSHAQNAPSQQPEMPPARAIPGITADDPYPRACVDCHINYVAMNRDTRLSTLIAQWTEGVSPELLEITRAVAGSNVQLKGVHPRVRDAVLRDIPDSCLSCHEHNARHTPPLVPLLHAIHLGGGGEAVFLRMFQGECTHCHKWNRTTGEWQIPSGPED